MNNFIYPEILSPAGSFEALVAAVSNGASSVYFGGQNFNARHFSKNFTIEEIKKGIDFCHLHGVKAYNTVNTVYKNEEFEELFEFVAKLYELGSDAFIISDLSLIPFIKNNFKNAVIHASTQMSVSDVESAKFLKEQGVSRVVLGRELSLDKIKEITEKSGIETEVFVHGALCVSYSGQCYMSSLIGGRSGNRGTCAQSCRKDYEFLQGEKIITDGYLLSPKDIMTLDMLNEIVKTNVSALKIEGRMKSVEYVSLTTKYYREQVERIKNGKSFVSTEEIENITQVFNRGGSFSQGYYQTHSGKDMLSIETPKNTGIFVGEVLSYNKSTKSCIINLKKDLKPGDGIEIWNTGKHVGTGINKPLKAFSKAHITISGNIKEGDKVFRSYDKELHDKFSKTENNTKNTVFCDVSAVLGNPLTIKVYNDKISSFKEGSTVLKAEKAPVTKEKLLTQISKTKDTPFHLEFNNVQIDDNIFISISEINALRREVLENFQDLLVKSFENKKVGFTIEKHTATPSLQKEITVQISDLQSFESALVDGVYALYVNICPEFLKDVDYFVAKAKEKNIKLFAAFSQYSDDLAYLEKLKDKNIDGFLVKTLGQLKNVKDLGKEIVTDFGFNITNSFSYDFLQKTASRVTLSYEMTLNQINDIDGLHSEILIYGLLPLMVTRMCPVGIFMGEKGKDKYCKFKGIKDDFYLKDEKDALFPVINDCDNCIAHILNCKALYLLNKYKDLEKSNPKYLRLFFTTETKEETNEIIKAHVNTFKNGSSSLEEELNEKMLQKGITNGHYYRGVL